MDDEDRAKKLKSLRWSITEVIAHVGEVEDALAEGGMTDAELDDAVRWGQAIASIPWVAFDLVKD